MLIFFFNKQNKKKSLLLMVILFSTKKLTMKKTYFILILASLNFIFSNNMQGQVGIGTNTPDASAALDVVSTDKGMLIPRINLSDVTTTSLDGTNPAATGLLIWNTNASVTGGNGTGLYYFDGTQWQKLKSPGNTLDKAYDQGGAGAGRTITADDGAVEITGTDGLLVSGTFGSGQDAVHNTAPQMFFNPKKAAFRAGQVTGTQWDSSNLGDYSFATGYNTTASGKYAFAANNATEASGENATAFGYQTKAIGNAAFATGNQTEAQGNNSFTYGKDTKAGGDNSFAGGSNAEAPSVGEVAFGNFPTTYTRHAADASTFDTRDRAFVVGIGRSTTNRKNALEVWKDGKVIINQAYTLPTTDGSLNQILTTDGSGNLTWTDGGNDNIVAKTLYAGNSNFSYTYNPADNQPRTLFKFDTAVIPDLYNAQGDLRIKLVILIKSINDAAKFKFRIKATDISGGNSFPIGFNTPQTYTATGTGGVWESNWKNWAAGTDPHKIILQMEVQNGGSIEIANAYILLKSQ